MALSDAAASARTRLLALPAVREVRDWRPLTAGNSRGMWAALVTDTDGRTRSVVVRMDQGDGPLSGTPIHLGREAAVYRALTGRGLRLPELLADDTGLMVLEHVDGSTTWRNDSFSDLLEELHRLHTTGVAPTDLPELPGSALADVRQWAAIASALPADPFVTAGVDVLLDRFPGEPVRTVLCHGDAGPGNVLFAADGSLAALLDWEFAHFGDPIDDLAWVTVRAQLLGIPLPDVAATVDRCWPDSVDPARLQYWRAVVLWRNLVACAAVIAQPDGADKLVQLGLVPALRALLVDALCRLTGTMTECDPLRPAVLLGPPPPHDPGARALREVALELRALESCVEGDAALRARIARTRVLADQLARTWGRAGPGADPPGPWGLEELAGEAARGLALFPRAQRIAAASGRG